MDQDQRLLNGVSAALSENSDAGCEGTSIGSILRRIGTQLEGIQSESGEEFDFEAKEDRLNSVWSIE